MVPGECCALWYTGFTVKSSDFGHFRQALRPSGYISILSKAESSRFTGSFGEDCCFGESLKVKKHMFGKVWAVKWHDIHEFPCYIYQPRRIFSWSHLMIPWRQFGMTHEVFGFIDGWNVGGSFENLQAWICSSFCYRWILVVQTTRLHHGNRGNLSIPRTICFCVVLSHCRF